MNASKNIKINGIFVGLFSIVSLLFATHGFSKTITQLTPTFTISEEYSDNYFKTDNNEEEEFITRYELGFSVGFIDKKKSLYLNYRPEYKDYKNLEGRDDFIQNVSLQAQLKPSRTSNINADLTYTSNDSELAGDSWKNSAVISGDVMLTKHTQFRFSESYTQNFDQQLRTGAYTEHDINKTRVGLTNKFGKKRKLGVNFTYSFDDYDNRDADEYKRYVPSAFITYWVTPLNGINSRITYRKTDFDNSSDDIETYRGHIRYLRKFSKHFTGFVKYRHSYSERESGNHHVFHPSAGFDWEVTDDSGISVGLGALINEWDNNNEDSVDPFIDIDAYKTFNFSRKGSLTVTGSSGYDESSDSASSLGYNIYYKVGANLRYMLHKRVSSRAYFSYKRDEFDETSVNRVDNTFRVGCGLSWTPLKWMKVNLSGFHKSFDTNSSGRDDYQENKATLSISLIPTKPVRLDQSLTRDLLDSEIF